MVDWLNPSPDALAGIDAGRQDMQGQIEELENQVAFLEEANADLLEACKEMLRALVDPSRELLDSTRREMRPCVRILEAAIAKAEGNSPAEAAKK